MKFLIATLFASTLMVFNTADASAADAAKGYALAKERCVRCHNVEPGGAFKQRPPSFQAIAIYRTADDIWARMVVPSPHSGMPDTLWVLEMEEIKDVAAYIASLDKPVTIEP